MEQTRLRPVGEYPWEIKDFCRVEAGWEPTDDQLKYWRENQVIRSLGDVPHPGGNGRVSLYAPGTSGLVARLHYLLAQKSSLAVATWALWKEGFEVDERWTRRRLTDVAQSWDVLVADVKERAFEGPNQEAFSDEFFKAIDPSKRFGDRRLRLTRKLVGSKRLHTLLFYILRMAFGHKISSPLAHSAMGHSGEEMAGEQGVVITGLGFDRMLVDRVEGTRPSSKTDIIGPLDKVAEPFSKPLLPRIKSASDADLLTAAREIEAVRTNNRFSYKALSWLFGRHAFGWGHAARIFGEYDNTDEVRLVTLWVVTRQAFIPELALEMQIHEQKLAEAFYVKSERARLAALENPGLRKRILDAIRKKR